MQAIDLKLRACSRKCPTLTAVLLCSSLQVEVASSDTIQELVSHANRARSTGSTGVNEDSSRSHSIMQFALKREGEADGHPLGKISFIDLAGSERGADTYDNNR